MLSGVNKWILISAAGNLILLMLVIWLIRKPAEVIYSKDTTLDEYLLKENAQLQREIGVLQFEFQLIEDAINKDSAAVWDADRHKRDSLRAALNPR